MKVSIITVCYNPGKILREALKSLLSQDYHNIEFIVVDGGSSDGTVDYIRSICGEKINKLISEPDNGVYDALNKGVGSSTGDIVGFLHSDDMFYRTTVLSEIVSKFSNKSVDAVYGDLLYVARENTERTIRYWKSGIYKPELLKFGWMPPHPALYVRRVVYEKAKLCNGEYFDTRMTCSADYDFMLRLINKLKISIVYLPKILVKMRVGGISNRSIKNIIQKSREDLIAIRRNDIGGIGTLVVKNLRKCPQFFMKR